MKYQILSNRIASRLEEEVRKFLQDGWELHGNLIYGEMEVQRGEYSTTTVKIPMFYQAIVERDITD